MCEMESLNQVMAHSPEPLATFNQLPGGSESRYESEDEYDQFSDAELQLAQQFLEQIGCPDRALELLDKVIECDECLGIDDDAQQIETMALIIPDDPELPTNGAFAAQFNPGQIT